MLQQFRGAILCAGLISSALLTGCAGVAPNYPPSIENVESLKKIGGTGLLKTGSFGVTPGMTGATSISLRGSSMVSPVGKNYGDYLEAALKQELDLAKLYNPQSGVEISGTLITNNIDAGGVSTNAGQIEARFVVSSGGKVLFDKAKRVERQWKSSFIGATAIPLAANNYTFLVQSLVSALIADPDFVAAIRN